MTDPTTYTITGGFEIGTWLPPAITDPPPTNGPGVSQGLPILPSSGDSSGMTFRGWLNGRYVDPPLASGFEFATTDGSHFSAIMSLPVGVDGDNQMLVSAEGQPLGFFGGGDSVDFVSLRGHGVSTFQVTGIDPAVDAENSLAFPIKLMLDREITSFTMAPLPEPGVGLILGSGALGLVGVGRRRSDPH